jgi:two-component system, NarL family, nitrate/nitrite response regulator NarL
MTALANRLIKTLVVHGELAMQQGLAMRLAIEPDVRVVGAANDAVQSLAKVIELHPDVVLIDINLAARNGMAAIHTIRSLAPEAGIILLACQCDPETVAEAQAAGADAFVEFCKGDAGLLDTIRSVAADGTS